MRRPSPVSEGTNEDSEILGPGRPMARDLHDHACPARVASCEIETPPQLRWRLHGHLATLSCTWRNRQLSRSPLTRTHSHHDNPAMSEQQQPSQPPANAPPAAMAVDPSQGTTDNPAAGSGTNPGQVPSAASFQPPAQSFPQGPYMAPQPYFNPASHTGYPPSNAGSFGYPFATPFGAHPPQPQSQPSAPHPAYGSQFSPATAPTPSMPPGMPPLMPLNHMSWGPVPDQALLVAHTGQCPLCAEFLRHYAAGQPEPSFREAQTSVQAQLQARFWQYFQEHHRSEGGGAALERITAERAIEREENTRRVQELSTQLTEARRESENRQQRLERYRREREAVRQQLEETRAERDRLANRLDDARAQMPPSRYRGRDARERSPQRSGYRTYQSQPVAGPSIRRSRSRRAASPPLNYDSPPHESSARHQTTANAPVAGPSSSPGTSRGRTEREHPMVDFEASSVDDDYVDEKRIKKLSERQRRRRIQWGQDPPPAPGQGPAFGSTAVGWTRPRIEGWPYDLVVPPEDSDPRLANHWYNFIPVTSDDAQTLIEAARHDMGEARARIQHLLTQVNRNSALTGVRGIRALADGWRRGDLSTIGHPAAYTPPSIEHMHTGNLPIPVGRQPRHAPAAARPQRTPGLNQPRRDAPATELQGWFKMYPKSTPSWMAVDQDGLPFLNHVEYHQMARRPIGQGVSIEDRGRWLALTNALFSVPGLYRHILTLGQYPVGASLIREFFPGDYAEGNLTIFHVARWYAHLGVSADWGDVHQEAAYRSRANQQGLIVDSNNHHFVGVRSISDVPHVPSVLQLGVLSGPPYLPNAALPAQPVPVGPTAALPAAPANSGAMDVEPNDDDIRSTPPMSQAVSREATAPPSAPNSGSPAAPGDETMET